MLPLPYVVFNIKDIYICFLFLFQMNYTGMQCWNLDFVLMLHFFGNLNPFFSFICLWMLVIKHYPEITALFGEKNPILQFKAD